MDATVNITSAALNVRSILSELETELGSQLFGATIMRIRGEIFVQHATIGTVRATGMFGWGVHLAPAQVVTASNHPDPTGVQAAGGQHADWMGYGVHYTVEGTTAEQGTGALDGGAYLRIPIDIRARRRLDEVGDAAFLVMACNATKSYDVIATLSTLVALP